MILIIDNYDSFTYNLVQYIGSINPKLDVVRNNMYSKLIKKIFKIFYKKSSYFKKNDKFFKSFIKKINLI